MGFREGNEKPEESQQALKLDEAPDDDETKVRLDEPDEDTDPDDAAEPEKAAAGEKPGPSRKKDGTWASKKADRSKERRDGKAWEREREEYDRRFAREREETDRRLGEMRQEVERLRNSGGGERQQPDAFKSRMTEINTQIASELKLLESDDKHDYTRYHQLQEQKIALIAQQQAAMLFANHAQQNQQPQDKYSGRRPIIASEFPWTDDRRYDDLSRKAFAYREYLINVEGKPDTLDTDREALQTALARWGGEFGLRAPVAPSQRTRSLWTAPASRGAPAGRSTPQEVELGEIGRGTGLSQRSLAAAVRSAMNDES